MINFKNYSQETFESAKTQNRPIFIFVGCSASVHSLNIEKELFTNEQIVSFLNAHFVCVKVDKDERTELDLYYQKAYKLLNNANGGWPLLVFATPSNQPFHAKTYMPTHSQDKLLGFYEFCEIIVDKIESKDSDFFKNADEVAEHLTLSDRNKEATRLSLILTQSYIAQAKENFDENSGGFFADPKFPNSSIVNTLLDFYEKESNAEVLNMVTKTLSMLNRTASKNAKGFWYRHAYSEEFTLYDQALLVQTFVKAYKILKNEEYKDVAFKCCEFMLENMSDDGLFYLYENDKRVITSQNSMMISALFKVSELDEKYLPIALNSLEKLSAKMYVNSTLYHYENVKGFLEDFAYFGVALINAYEKSGDEIYFIQAQLIANSALSNFYDNGRWFYTKTKFSIDGDIYDSHMPSYIGAICELMVALAEKEPKYISFTKKSIEYYSYSLARDMIYSSYLFKEAMSIIANKL
ncbi:MAG: DUF255 domain-containing protein [Helicobacteraceae bacterium]|nr:DUF255 domain-containing protein [Helicobacteraceae bacterium]